MDEAEIGELVEDAVDARDPDLAAVRAEAVEHLLGGEAAVVLAEMGDDRLARRARPRPGAAQLGARVLLPALALRSCLDGSCSHLRRLVDSRRDANENCSHLSAHRGRDRGDGLRRRRRREGGGRRGRRGVLPARVPRGAGRSRRRRPQPDPAGGGAARPRALAAGRRPCCARRGASCTSAAASCRRSRTRSRAGANAVDLLAGVPRIGDDPHVWLDPGRYASLARRVAEALGDPAAADALVARLERLDQRVPRRPRRTASGARSSRATRRSGTSRRRTASSRSRSPASARRRSRARGAWRRSSSGSGASARRPSSSRRSSRRSSPRPWRGRRAHETAVLDPLEGLTDEDAARGDDYFGVMRRNLAALRAALGCR